jgi:hypothetical protein
MGLPARQRRALDRIECGLRGSDPRLAALYAIFHRLTRDEQMPRIEELRHRAVVAIAHLRFRLVSLLFRRKRRLVPRQRAAIFFPLALALAVTSIVFAARSGPGSRCTPVTPLAAGAKYISATKLCRTGPVLTSVGH